MKLLDCLLKYLRSTLLLCILLCSLQSYSQCKLKHSVQIEHASTKQGKGKIHLSLNGASESVNLKLYIVYNSEIKLISEKTFASSSSDGKVTFENLNAGLYYLVAKSSSCELSIGGIEGITVN